MTELIALSNLQGTSIEAGGTTINWPHEIPGFAEPERIGVNVALLGKLARLAGLGELTIRESPDHGSKIDEPSVVGTDARGNAFAGKAVSTRQAEPQSIHIHYGTDDTIKLAYPDYWHPDGTIELNSQAIARAIAQQRDTNTLREPGKWADQLDSQIKSGVRDLAYRALVKDTPLYQKLAFAASLGNAATWVAIRGDIIGGVELYLFGSVLAQLTVAALAYYRQGLGPLEGRWSLMPFMHADRAIATDGLTRILRIVKRLPE